VAEKSDGTLSIASNGAGVTNVIQQYINSDVLDRDLVERTLLGELNKIFYPDANYLRIMVQQQQRAGLETWEVYLEEAVKGRVPMSHTGSGLKTVLLVLANVLIAPLLDDRKPADYLFAFEELENNLHPAVQRRLFRYLRDKAANDGCHFFITTHSNVVIDMFSDDRKAQLLHVTHNSEHSTVATVETYKHGHGVLDDLDVRASDLLQTNAVVWVEGPSDRIYFNRWIELWTDNQLVEGIHYQCLTYGGSVNAHLSFLEPEAVDDLISALKINRHAILLIDRDVKPPGELKPHTQRLVDEIKTVGGYDWVTAGKEVENYIPIEALRTLLEKPDAKNPGSFANILEYIRKQKENKQQPRKVDLAHDVIKLLTKESIKATHDLAAQLTHVEGLIRKWNRIPTV
jgi:hypothetical protein